MKKVVMGRLQELLSELTMVWRKEQVQGLEIGSLSCLGANVWE